MKAGQISRKCRSIWGFLKSQELESSDFQNSAGNTGVSGFQNTGMNYQSSRMPQFRIDGHCRGL